MSVDSLVLASLMKAPVRRVLPLLERSNSVLNHDFCPSFNRWIYWLKNPFWCLMLAIALSLVCGICLSPSALFLTAILSTVLAVGVLLPWLAMRGIDVHLTFDVRRGRVGQPVLIRLKVRNRWPWPVWGLSLVRGFALRDSADSSEGVSLARVPGWSTVEYSWQFVPQTRGLYPLTAAEVETAFPFGLYRAMKQATVDGSVIVWPDTVLLSGLPDAAEVRYSEDQLGDRRVGEFGDMMGTRLYRQGDSLRRVHWAQTARQQQMIVCERQAPATSTVQVTVDLSFASHAQCDPSQRHQDDSVELAVQVAASVCESLHRQQSRLELLLGDNVYSAGEGMSGFQRMMDALAQASLSDSVGRRSRMVSGDAFGILVTTPLGMRMHGAAFSRKHVITVSDDSALQSTVADVSRWIALASRQEVKEVLPRRWKGACNVR